MLFRSVSGIRIVQIGHHTNPDNRRRAVEYDNQSTLTIPIRHPCRAEHPSGCEYIRRESEDLTHGHRMAHVVAQDDGEKVPERVSENVVEEKKPGKLPNLPVAEMEENFGIGEFVDDGISAVDFDAAEDYGGFVFGEEDAAGYGGGLGGFVGEVDDENVAYET